MNRRSLLKLTGALGAVGVVGRYTLLPPSHSASLESVDVLARRLFDSLDPDEHAGACVGYDHPLRQYHNRGVSAGGMRVWNNFGWGQRSMLVDLLHAGLSEQGRARIPRQFFLRWPGIHMTNVLFCGDPSAPPYQVIFSGPHLNLRVGGTCREEVAFGGPQVYGDQRGNERTGLPGNVYRYQLELATRLFESLTPSEHEAATLPYEPVQTQIEVRGPRADLPGVPLADASASSQRIADQLVDGILENYPEPDVAFAKECLEHNGGIDALHLSHYLTGEDGPSGPYQIFRLEGPGAVFHFRGHPHVHAFLNVAKHADRPLSVGEVLGDNPTTLEGEAVKQLFEDSLRHAAVAEAGHYPLQSVVGRLRNGTIRSGDIYNLESWQDQLVLVEVRGGTLRQPLLQSLERQGIDPDPSLPRTIATTAYAAAHLAEEELGEISTIQTVGSVRDAAIAYLRERPFPHNT